MPKAEASKSNLIAHNQLDRRGTQSKCPINKSETRNQGNAQTRDGTKQAMIIELLKRPGGATLAEIVEATGWQAHTVRGAMAGALKKKLGLTVTSEKDAVRGRVYRVD